MKQVIQQNLSWKIFKIQPEKILIQQDSTDFRPWSGKGVKVTSQSHFHLEGFGNILGSEGSLQELPQGDTVFSSGLWPESVTTEQMVTLRGKTTIHY